MGSDKLHKEAHQLIDIVELFRPITKWNQRVERIDAIPEIVRKAFRVAQLEKPGPTHIELPENRAQMPPESGDRTRPLVPRSTYFPEPTDEAIEHAARLVAAAERPHPAGRERGPSAACRAGPARRSPKPCTSPWR